jgi:hypothetical protein
MSQTAERPRRTDNTTVMGIRSLLDEAHANLPTETLAELLLVVRRTLNETADGHSPWWTHFQFPSLRPGLSQAARVYLRPIELLIHLRTERNGGLTPAAIRALDSYLDDLASRPRGAAFTAVAPAA